MQVGVENRKSSTTFGLTTFGLIPTLPPGDVDYYFLVIWITITKQVQHHRCS